MKKNVLFLILGALFLCSCQEDILEETSVSNSLGGAIPPKEILWKTKSVDGLTTKAVGIKSKYWRVRDTIRIKFLNGNSELQQKVKQYAAIWLDYACVFFKYVAVTDSADVKISFDMDDKYIAWSTLGKDCQAIPQDQPSLNFAYLEYEDEIGIKAEVLRGFGQVLGLGFEHRSPASPVKFKATADIVGEYGLSEAEVEEFKQLYTPSSTDYTDYDKSSIMTLTIPRSFVMVPTMATSRNIDLSAQDKELIRQIYPKPILVVGWMEAIVHFYVQLREEITVDWGDGTREVLTEDKEYFRNIFDGKPLRELLFFGSNSAIRTFFTDENRYAYIDVTGSPHLQRLYCTGAGLTSLDVSHNPNLLVLVCGENKLDKLDLSKNVHLWTLDCHDNNLSSLQIKQCDSLIDVEFYGNPFYDNRDSLIKVVKDLTPTNELGTFVVIEKLDSYIESLLTDKGWFVYQRPKKNSLNRSGERSDGLGWRLYANIDDALTRKRNLDFKK